MVTNVHRVETLLWRAGLDSSRLRVVVAPCAIAGDDGITGRS
jgi:hypothetical protein